MINLRIGEKLLNSFEVKKSFHGRGIFYITNLRICLETQMNGLILDLPFEILKTYKNTSTDSFRIEWEYDNNRLYYKFKVQGSAKEVFDAYTIANKEFSQSTSECDALQQRYFAPDVTENSDDKNIRKKLNSF